jgi:hypothetical protein
MSDIWSKTYIGAHVKYPLFLSVLNEILILSTDFRKILKYQILLKDVQWESSCPIRTDWHDDDKLSLFEMPQTRLKHTGWPRLPLDICRYDCGPPVAVNYKKWEQTSCYWSACHLFFRRLHRIAKMRLLPSSCLSVRASARNNSAPTGRIFNEIWLLSIFWKSVEKLQV